MASRRKGRILAFQALFAWEAADGAETDFSWVEDEKLARLKEDGTVDFSRLLIRGTIENIGPVDAIIRRHLKNWDFSRLSRIDLALLRMSTYTLQYQKDIAPSIVIDEAIDIAKEFGTDDSFRFINGVLDSIRKTLQESPNAPAEANP